MVPRSILVTGASGFVGHHLLAALQSSLPETRLIPTSRREGVTIGDLPALTLQLDRPEDVRKLLGELQPEIIVHLGAEAAVGRAHADPAAVWESNFRQTVEFAEVARAHAPDTIFVFISSASVYGRIFQTVPLVDEDQRMEPMDPYGAAKAAADLAIGEMAGRGLHAIRPRPFNHTGPGQSANFVIPALARQIARIEAGLQEPVIRTGMIEVGRDFLDVRDVCAAYVKIIIAGREIPPGTVLNIASGEARIIKDVLHELLRISGVDAKIETEASRLRPDDIRTMRGDASKIRRLLDWHPTIPFAKTLQDTLEWWRRHPD